ncbi:hypothetical protein JXA32_13580 [Candidatus Sumerlaeota bacterium]|nr:hypothetical protein [Candidatus Sumerlaeota bacterium]
MSPNWTDVVLAITTGLLAFMTCVLAVATCVLAYFAWKGLDTWKQQIKGQDEYSLAKRILRLCFQYRDAIAAIRHPRIFNSPLADPPSKNERPFDWRYKIYKEWLQNIRSVRSEFYPELLQSEIFWDQDLNSLMEPLYDLEDKLWLAINDELTAINPDTDQGIKDELNEQKTKEQRKKILRASCRAKNGTLRENLFNDKFEEAMKSVADFLKTKMQ